MEPYGIDPNLNVLLLKQAMQKEQIASVPQIGINDMLWVGKGGVV